MRWQLSDVVQPGMPQWVYLGSIELVIRRIIHPTVPQVELVVVFVVLVSIPTLPSQSSVDVSIKSCTDH